jgi:hypothetical protein
MVLLAYIGVGIILLGCFLVYLKERTPDFSDPDDGLVFDSTDGVWKSPDQMEKEVTTTK